MSKLLLTSTGFSNPKLAQEFLRLAGKEPNQIKILFIPTAAQTDEEWQYVKESKKELENLGIKAENIIEFNLDRDIPDNELKSMDTIYVCGGNTFYLLHKIRDSGFDKKIIDLVNNQDKIFIGVSAGSILAGPNIDIASPWDKNEVNLTDLTALNLTDIIVSPHYVEEEKEIIDKFKDKYDYEIISLTDKQGLLVEDDKKQIIE